MKTLFLFFLFYFPTFNVVYGQDCEKNFKIEIDKFSKVKNLKSKERIFMRPHIANTPYGFEIHLLKFEDNNILLQIYIYEAKGGRNYPKIVSPLHKFDFLFDDDGSVLNMSVSNSKVGQNAYFLDLSIDEKGKSLFEHLKTKKLKAIRVDGISKETNKNNSKQLQDLINCIENTKL